MAENSCLVHFDGATKLAGTQICRDCGEEMPIEDERIAKVDWDTLAVGPSYCMKCGNKRLVAEAL